MRIPRFLNKSKIIPFDRETEEKHGKGFYFRGKTYVHYGNLHHNQSAFITLTNNQKIIISAFLSALAMGLFFDWHATIVALISAVTVIYFLDLLFNFLLIIKSYNKSPEIDVTEEEIQAYRNYNWPVYTILCPLYREANVITQFIKAISVLDYPKDKLQVILLLEQDDQESINRVNKIRLPRFIDVVVVPHSLPKTKPKAMNYGLKRALGEFTVIYDAEDVPDIEQLKKSVIAYNKVDKNTVCLQAKLNFYNSRQNLITRIFTAEYSLWFDLVLTGLQSISAPIPLGGTSNHFRTSMLKQLRGWDAFNVTEDCDLGMRIAKKGYKTAIINSTTLEEANSNIINWFNQRSRWIKGYIQTYLVHMRQPGQFKSRLREPHIAVFQIVVGAKIFSMFVNPMLWFITLTYYFSPPYIQSFVRSFYPTPILYMGTCALIFGNFLYLYCYMLGCSKRKQYGIIKYAFITPFYWLFMSIAATRSVKQIIINPHYWSKTVHGLHLSYDK